MKKTLTAVVLVITMPVSYTHLDVYKRQLGQQRRAFLKRFNQAELYDSDQAFGTRKESYTAVGSQCLPAASYEFSPCHQGL